MTPDTLERVFGRGRLRMATGAHVEVFREAAAPGESRRYTKRFLTTAEGDYAQWTEREWRILARLIGHGSRCVPDVVHYDGGGMRGVKVVQTYDAGATVDQWATLLPVERDGRVLAHVFADAAHWWALAHHCLVALDEIHSLDLVHLDVKADNVCIPIGPPAYDPSAPGQRLFPVFRKLALIDFAFSLVSGETLESALPIGWQRDYDYQSPRLLAALAAGRAGDLGPTEALDWRCDVYSLAAMLERYRVGEPALDAGDRDNGWSGHRIDAAKSLIGRLREAHDRETPGRRPHAELIALTSAELGASDLVESLDRGWSLALGARPAAVPAVSPTPVTRLAPPVRVFIPPRDDPLVHALVQDERPVLVHAAKPARGAGLAAAAVATLVAVGSIAAVTLSDGWKLPSLDGVRSDARDRANDARDAAPARAAQEVAANEPNASHDEGRVQEAASAQERASDPASAAHASPVVDSEKAAPPATDAVARPAPATAGIAPSAAKPPAGERSLAAQIESFRRDKSKGAGVAGASRNAAAAAPRAGEKRSADVAAPTKPGRALPAAPPTRLAAQRSLPTAGAKARAPSSTVIASAAGARTPHPLPQSSKAAATPAVADAAREPPIALAATPPIEPLPPAPIVPTPAPLPVLEAPRSSLPMIAADPSRGVARPGPGGRSLAPIVEASREATSAIAAAPRMTPPLTIGDARMRSANIDIAPGDGYASRARRVLDDVVPRAASTAQARLNRVLWVAAGPTSASQDRALFDAAAFVGQTTAAGPDDAPAEARRLHDEARRAYRVRRHVPEAFDLAMKAFGANPNDPDAAGHLAFLHLKTLPSQPERARQLALVAIGLRGSASMSIRVDDWTTFAVASALTGRTADARNALYASSVLSRDAEYSCRSAMAALVTWGDRMRDAVESLLHRLQAQGRVEEASACAASSRVAAYRFQ